MKLFGPKNTVSWTSSKTSAEKAGKELAKETEKMAKKGYTLVSSTWAPSGKGLGTIVKAVIFLPLAFTGGGKGQVTAVFQRAT